MAIRHTFQHNEKLKSKKFIDLLFKQGKSFHCFPFRVTYLQNEPSFDLPESKSFLPAFPIKFGISVSTKNFKKATDRNKIKRLAREAWRLQKHVAYQLAKEHEMELGIFLIYTQKEILTFAEIEKAVEKLIDKLQKIMIPEN